MSSLVTYSSDLEGEHTARYAGSTREFNKMVARLSDQLSSDILRENAAAKADS